MTDQQEVISPDSMDTISSRQVTRIKKNIDYGIISWSNTKFSNLNHKNCVTNSEENY